MLLPRGLTREEIRDYADEPEEEVEAVALFTFHAQDYVDLSFKVGDTIMVTKRTESNYDWCYVIPCPTFQFSNTITGPVRSAAEAVSSPAIMFG